ncbi:cytochrome b [Rhizobium sp. CC-YZS058]|uniref:cytochrome b n=1 Tax=Rhizobium sp. CC-YZS058 TaxID=3042153 RepID=UPI002B05C873|nr:cytochrome b/b6 domain-containing protein [Rhizobium sp. CC-YZS058]MEA3534298.1 cytochrome b/b6 domain-containing protein [Rhizobium sp. CC-YZS058]
MDAASARYSTLQIALHWLIAAAVLFQLVFGESMTNVVDAAEEGATVSGSDQFLASAHYWVGLSILALVLVRLVARLTHGAPEPAGTALTRKAATTVHWLFYALLFATPIAGLLAVYVSEEFGDIHAAAKPVFIVLILAHAAGALFHQFVVKDGTLMRMIRARA